jgi:drug/metabolite transporter (DMT)-like permease
MLLGTFAVVILRYLKNIHFALITSVYGVVGTIVSLLLCFVVGSFEWPKSTRHWCYAFVIAKLTFLGHNTLTMALQYEQAGPVALVRTSEIIFTFGWQILFFQLFPDLLG